MNDTFVRQSVINALAGIGFIAILGLGMLAAVYLARFVPTAVSGVASAIVSVSSVFFPSDEGNGIVIIPPTVPGGVSTTTTPGEIATSTGSTGAVSNPGTPGGEQTGTYLIGTTTVSTNPYGLPDLVPTIIATGIMTGTTTNSFVATSTPSTKDRIGIRFSVKNEGTNVSGVWRFSVVIPTDSAYVFESPIQQSLNPGERVEYTLGFDRARAGTNQKISIRADFSNLVNESNESNNSANTAVTIIAR
jgi:hypothetical protein